MDVHNKAVESVSAKVKAFADSKTPFRIYHGDTLSTRLSTRRSNQVVDISRLNNVININAAARLATVEPNLSFDALVTATLKEGLIPQVVTSFPSTTVGGAFVGTAAQSSSVTVGFFEKTVAGVEVILGNGSIIKARDEGENSEVFHDLAGSCGTLGVVTLLDVKLMKSRTYVELKYIPIYSAAEALAVLQKYHKVLNINYLDAILFSSKVGVVMIGRLSNHREVLHPIVRFNRAKDNWFYLHAHSQIPHSDACGTCPFSSPGSDDMDGRHARDLIPIEDYFFRFDRGNMWMGIYGQDPKSFGDKSRWMIDWMARTKNMQRAVHHSGRSQSFIVQDVTMPQEKGLEFLHWADHKLGIYPTWICPIAPSTSSPNRPFTKMNSGGMLLSVNIWGLKAASSKKYKDIVGNDAYKRFVEDNRMLETKINQVGGFKWSYGQHYHNEDEFWNGYDKKAVDDARRKWHASNLPTLWDKLKNEHDGCVDKGWLSKALVKTLLGMDHLLDQPGGVSEKQA